VSRLDNNRCVVLLVAVRRRCHQDRLVMHGWGWRRHMRCCWQVCPRWRRSSSSALLRPRPGDADRSGAVLSHAIDPIKRLDGALSRILTLVNNKGTTLTRGRLASHQVNVSKCAISGEHRHQVFLCAVRRQAATEDLVLLSIVHSACFSLATLMAVESGFHRSLWSHEATCPLLLPP